MLTPALKKTVTAASCVLLMAALPADALDMFVGDAGNAACTHATIQDALDTAALTLGSDVIYVAQDQNWSDQALVIDGQSAPTGEEFGVTIIGGLASCSAAPQAGQLTRIGGDSLPVLSIDNGSAVLLSQLQFEFSSGTGVDITSSTVHLQSVWSRNNGRGIAVKSSSSVSLRDSRLTGSDTGGGLLCSDSQVEMVDTVISSNDASNGGGLRAVDCLLEFAGEIEISDNSANQNGGGVYMISSSVTDLPNPPEGTSPTAVLIEGNRATLAGGGLHLQASFFGVDNTRIVNNSAIEEQGGGAYLFVSSILRLARGDGCIGRCAEISDNRISDVSNQTRGAAVYAISNSEVYLFSGAFSSNRSAQEDAYPFYLGDSFGWFENVEIYGNRGPAVAYADNSSELTLAFVSAADNRTQLGDPAPIVRSEDSMTIIRSSAFRDTAGFEPIGSGSVDVDCVMSDNLSGATSGDVSILDDPEFMNPAAGDLRLSPTSPAVDYCDDQVYSPLFRDLQGEPRGHDHENNAEGSPGVPGGTYDLGADEVWWFFQDGFESGDPSRWSAISS